MNTELKTALNALKEGVDLMIKYAKLDLAENPDNEKAKGIIEACEGHLVSIHLVKTLYGIQ